MHKQPQVHLAAPSGSDVQAQPPKRAYSIGEWQRDFARAFAAAVPLEAVRTQARGPLLAADNDEGEPNTFARIEAEANADARAIVRHAITRETRGSGIGAEHTPVCCCGWRGSAVGEYNDYMSTELKRQEHAHLAESKSATRCEPMPSRPHAEGAHQPQGANHATKHDHDEFVLNQPGRRRDSATAGASRILETDGLTQQATNNPCVTARKDGQPFEETQAESRAIVSQARTPIGGAV